MSTTGQTTSLAERVEIGERWQDGQNDTEIALALQRPKSTIRKWRRKYQQQGRAGLTSKMGRSPSGALGNFVPVLAETISDMRQAHPGWGALTILIELQKDARFSEQRLPSRSRIAAYLKEKHSLRKYELHIALPEPKRERLERPHQEWEIDAQGKMTVTGLGSASLINIMDVVSHVKVESLACLQTTHANTQDYQLILRRAFVRYGLPEQISFDHDSVFYDNQTKSPFPTWLHLWLVALGVSVRFIHQQPPAEHAHIERDHQTMTQQVVAGQSFANATELQNNLTERTDFLNWDYPSRTSQGKPPLLACPQALHVQRPYRLEWEKEMLDVQRVYDYLAKGRWFRLTSTVGMFSLGAQRYNASVKFAKQTLEITFDPQTAELVCLPETQSQSFRLALQGLTKENLLGELDPLTSIPAYQLALPFSRQDWRQVMLSQDLPGTTF